MRRTAFLSCVVVVATVVSGALYSIQTGLISFGFVPEQRLELLIDFELVVNAMMIATAVLAVVLLGLRKSIASPSVVESQYDDAKWFFYPAAGKVLKIIRAVNLTFLVNFFLGMSAIVLGVLVYGL